GSRALAQDQDFGRADLYTDQGAGGSYPQVACRNMYYSARVLGGCFMVDFRLFFYKTAGGHSSFVVTAVCLYQVI
ncbi:unnamed protein product, partial [Ectocarpus sp. 8 AP-2014]